MTFYGIKIDSFSSYKFYIIETHSRLSMDFPVSQSVNMSNSALTQVYFTRFLVSTPMEVFIRFMGKYVALNTQN